MLEIPTSKQMASAATVYSRYCRKKEVTSGRMAGELCI